MSPKKQAPITFTSALNYVDKVKKRFAAQPEIYKSFLAILQEYERDSIPLLDVYAQVTQLLSTAPDLVEDFQQFLPEPAAAQAKLPVLFNTLCHISSVRPVLESK